MQSELPIEIPLGAFFLVLQDESRFQVSCLLSASILCLHYLVEMLSQGNVPEINAFVDCLRSYDLVSLIEIH